MVSGRQGCVDCVWTGLVLLLEELLVILEDIVALGFVLEWVSRILVGGAKVAQEVIEPGAVGSFAVV